MSSKTCSKCHQTLPLDQFGRQKICPDGLRYECKACQRAYMAEWRSRNREYLRDAENRRRERMTEEELARKRALDNARYHRAPEVARDKLLQRKYGISLVDYESMLAAQGGGCAICGSYEPRRVLAVDHHHGTGVVRGLLCDGCNNGLGRFRDDPELLTRAIAYLLNT